MSNEGNLDDFLRQVVGSVLQTVSMKFNEDWTNDPEKVSLVIAAFQAYLEALQGGIPNQEENEEEEKPKEITAERIAEAKKLIERTPYKNKGPYQQAVNLLIDAHQLGLI